MIACATALTATLGALWIVPTHLIKKAQIASLRRACSTRRVLTLTYDDGPGDRLTPLVLDLLKERNVRASFFVVGSRAKDRPATVTRVLAEGHELGSHSYAHHHAWKSLPTVATRDLHRGLRTLDAWGSRQAAFRPPHGKLTLLSWLAVKRLRLPLAWWTVDSGDTWDPIPSVETLTQEVRAAGGGVVLLHDGDRSADRFAAHADFVLKATAALLDVAEEEGLTVVPLGEIRS